MLKKINIKSKDLTKIIEKLENYLCLLDIHFNVEFQYYKECKELNKFIIKLIRMEKVKFGKGIAIQPREFRKIIRYFEDYLDLLDMEFNSNINDENLKKEYKEKYSDIESFMDKLYNKYSNADSRIH